MVYLLEPVLAKLRMERLEGIPFGFAEKKNKGLDFSREDVPPEITIEGSFVLPDICRPTREFIFISERARGAFERLAPGCCRFFPLKVNAPARMKPESIYYYLDVTARAQTIDWERSETARRVVPAPGGGESRGVKAARLDLYAKFRPLTADDPPIWREADAEIAGVHFFESKIEEFVTDEFWQGLSKEFPSQLVAKRLGCG